MTLLEIEAAQKALDLLYNDIKEKKIPMPPEFKTLIHEHYNRLTQLKINHYG